MAAPGDTYLPTNPNAAPKFIAREKKAWNRWRNACLSKNCLIGNRRGRGIYFRKKAVPGRGRSAGRRPRYC